MTTIKRLRIQALSAVVFSGTVWGQAAAPAPRFLMTDVHAGAATPNAAMRGGFYRGGRYELHNASMFDLVRTAWGFDPDKVLGGPAWVRKDRFEIVATAPADTTPESLKTMLQELLAERFSLVVRRDVQPVQAYTITAGKTPLLKEADGAGPTGCNLVSNIPENTAPTPGPNIVRANINGNTIPINLNDPLPFACRNVTMAAFADSLRMMIGAQAYISNVQVVDQTELKGKWNFDIKWTFRQGPQTPAAGATVTMADGFEKLGLKLELSKVPLPVIMIDSVNETPTANLPGVSEKLAPAAAGFEIVDLKPSLPFPNSGGNQGPQMAGAPRLYFQGPGRIGLTAQSVKGLITAAWGLNAVDQVTGGPKSAESVLYDFAALAPTPELMPGFPVLGAGPYDIEPMKVMLQALLKERFKLAVHEDTGSVSAYELVAVKPTLKTADPRNPQGCIEGPAPGDKDPRGDNPAASRLVTCLNISVKDFSTELRNRASGYFGQLPPAVDATGIAGKYDVTLNFSPAGAAGPGSITLFDALEKQLGLKLQVGKRPGSVLVIDHCEENPIQN